MAVHTLMVVVHGVGHEFAQMALGSVAADQRLAVLVGLAALALIAAIHLAGTVLSRARPRQVQQTLGALFDPVQDALARGLRSQQAFGERDISPYHRVNGYPPSDQRYRELVRTDFDGWRLQVGGLVARRLSLSLEDLRRLPRQEQVTKHTCIQGWTAVASWAGVPLREVLDRCGPAPEARYVLLWAMDDKTETAAAGEHGRGFFYETIDLTLARHPQTILAYEMNGEPLPFEHGAPLRLRVESELGFKMVKWIRAIELIDDYRDVGAGRGGWREDNMFYSPTVAI